MRNIAQICPWVFVIFLIASTCSAQAYNINPMYGDPISECQSAIPAGQPSMPRSSDPIICHVEPYSSFPVFLIGYNTKNKDPYWVAYHLTKSHVENPIYPRTNNFVPDPDFDANKQASVSDYANSGYDRGHMDPAADNQWGKKAEDFSFYFSNIVPQNHACNAGIWATLEQDVRTWTSLRGNLYVVTGPIFSSNPKTIGSGVVIADSLYKVIYDQDTDEVISFIIPDKNIDSSKLPLYLASVTDVEKATGITFLPNLSEYIKEKKPTELWPLS